MWTYPEIARKRLAQTGAGLDVTRKENEGEAESEMDIRFRDVVAERDGEISRRMSVGKFMKTAIG